jgi:Lrp/AsnC family leucine-responsive transcriptional regulator
VSRMQLDMDDVNWRILALLQENARISFSEIGRQVGLTSTAVAERVRRLEDARVVRSYRIVPGDGELGYPITAFVTIAVHFGGAGQLVRLCSELAEVIECHHVTGEDAYLLRVRATSVHHLEEVLQRLRRVGEPTASIVLSTPIDHKPLRRPSQTSDAPTPLRVRSA